MAGEKIEEDGSIRLQEAADQNSMRPIWDFKRRPRTNTKAKIIAIKKTDGAKRKGMTETMKRRGEWEEECFRKKEDQLTPK